MSNLTIYFNESIVKGYLNSKAYDFAVEKDGEIVNFDVRFADGVSEFKAKIERYYKEFELVFKQRSKMEMKAISQRHSEYLRKIGESEPVEINHEPLEQRYQNAFIFRG